ncbi:hypothetical protein TNCV_3437341 [Trichonephila clavipes]|nr:hypothetical protein TNCV_3437341 [Trichonephila clavipes]
MTTNCSVGGRIPQIGGYSTIGWPAMYPDLNPIQPEWDNLGRSIASRRLAPTAIDELKSTLRQRAMNMNRYTNAALADIHFIYGIADGNERVAVQLYGKRYPTRRQPKHETFARLHQNLADHGFFRAMIDDMPINSEMDLVA